MDLNIGATVRCSDGEAGTLEKVVVGRDTGNVTHLIVSRGLLAVRHIVVPREKIARTDHHGVWLDMTIEELEKQPDVVESHLVAPSEDWKPPEHLKEGEEVWWGTNPEIASGPPYMMPLSSSSEPLLVEETVNVPLQSLSLSEGTVVEASDGRIGKIDEIIFDPTTNRATHIVVRQGLFTPHDLAIPVDDIVDATEERVVIKGTKEELAKMPEHVAK
jgi:uncharacterized protein YrrD